MSTADTLASVNAGVRFLLEVGALAALGYWGYRTGGGTASGIVLGVGVPLAVAVVWGLFGSPAAPYRLGDLGRLLLETAILGGATVALYATGRPYAALAFGVVAGINAALLRALTDE